MALKPDGSSRCSEDGKAQLQEDNDNIDITDYVSNKSGRAFWYLLRILHRLRCLDNVARRPSCC